MKSYSPSARHYADDRYADINGIRSLSSRSAQWEVRWIADEGQRFHVMNEQTVSFTVEVYQQLGYSFFFKR